MLILFDHGAPKGVARVLPAHRVVTVTAKAAGWDRLSNGALLKAAELASVDVLFNTDQRLRYQQNFAERKIAIVVLTGTTKWSNVRRHLSRISEAIEAVGSGSYSEVFIPFE